MGSITRNLLQNQFETELAQQQNQYDKLSVQYKSNKQIVETFEKSELQNATSILGTANLQFISGEINYLEFVMLCNQAIQIQSNYLDALKAYNDGLIALHFFNF